jgi:hypothetical protein
MASSRASVGRRGIVAVAVLALVAGLAGSGETAPGARRPPPAPRTGPVPAPRVVEPATADALAAAMGVPPATVVSADLGTSDPQGVGVGASRLGRWFPRQGATFAVLSTGRAADAELPDAQGDLSTIQAFDALKNSQGNDMVQLTLVLQPPPGAQCLGFDFAFYSEEFPEFVGSPFNDFFLAELGASTFTITGDEVSAPNNFAVDTAGRLITVNTVFGVTAGTLTTYDGVTPLLRAVGLFEPGGGPVTLVLTVTDLGDSIYDSAVLLDNFAWLSGADCVSGVVLAELIVSPPSGPVTPGEVFDFAILAAKPVATRRVLVNGIDVSADVAGCIPGTLAGGGQTLRCPAIVAGLLQGIFGPGPYLVDVTLEFDDGTSTSESAVYSFPTLLDTAPFRILPPSGTYALTQAFEVVLLFGLGGFPTGGTATLDGADVTGALVSCLQSETVADFLLAFRCPISGGLLSPGVHVLAISVELNGDPSQVVVDTVTWHVLANTEP